MDSCYHTISLVSGYCGVHPIELSLCLLPSLGFVTHTQSCLWYLIPSRTRKWSWWPSSGCWEEYLQLYGGEGRRGERDKLEGGSYLHMYVTTNTFELRSRLQASSGETSDVVQSVLWDNWAQTLAAIATCVERTLLCLYRIVGKFGKEFNLANWRGIERIAKLKIAKIILIVTHKNARALRKIYTSW